MSAEYEVLAGVRVVTDHDCGNYKVGDVESHADCAAFQEHIRTYGADGLRAAICHLLVHVQNAERAVMAEHQSSLFEEADDATVS